ncbi:membrane integrity-associated transporter subunit PqiC [Cognaticolwellia aestuarii]|uniref:PqiC family protein n=1 Tax=Cognaticolwellia aestuarii TaxID=329993 RepID=UPI0009870CA2|nr:PqiC family protein [Cognaticolwellia aestuarii]
MKQALIVFSLSIMLITACSSNNTAKTQYYLLNSPTLNKASDNNNNNKPVVIINLLELPEYLRQASLVLQLSEHQLHYAHFHMWAEPLQVSITEGLLQDLNAIDSHHNYMPVLNPQQLTSTTEVILKINAFHSTHQSQAILTGRYWLKEKNKNNAVKVHNFTLTADLNANGYPHAVEKMRAVITELANDIRKNMAVDTLNTAN